MEDPPPTKQQTTKKMASPWSPSQNPLRTLDRVETACCRCVASRHLARRPADDEASPPARDRAEGPAGRHEIRPISLLTLSLLRLLGSNFPGNPLWAWEFHPLKLRLCLSQTL